MFRPLIEKLSAKQSPLLQTGEVNLHNFGAVAEVAQPLPEAPLPIRHAESDFDLPINSRATRPDPKPSLSSLANSRLLSITPRSPARQKQVLAMIAALVAPLKALDALVTILEEEHFTEIENKMETVRLQGRALNDSMPALLSELATAQNYSNLAEEGRGRRRADFAQRIEEGRSISNWASLEERTAAADKIDKARTALDVATSKALERQQELATAESKVASARENLNLFQQEMRRCEAMLRGEPFFDPSTGLSTDPTAHRNSW